MDWLSSWGGRASRSSEPNDRKRSASADAAERSLSPNKLSPNPSGKNSPIPKMVPRRQQPTPPTRPVAPVEDWPQRPIMLRLNPLVDIKRLDGKSPDTMLTNTPEAVFSFESEGFVGRAFLRCRGLESSDEKGYFQGKNRTTQVVVSGQFKYEVPCAEVNCGQEFDRQFTNLPWLVTQIFKLIKAVVPGLSADIFADKPSVSLVMVRAAQNILVQELDTPEPDLTGEIPEDTKLLGGKFAGEKMLTPGERKSLFGDAKLAPQYSFKPGLRYTFNFFQHRLHWSSLKWTSPVGDYPLAPYMDGQPMQVLAKCPTKDGLKYLWSMEMWHESLLEKHEAHLKKKAQALELQRNRTI